MPDPQLESPPTHLAFRQVIEPQRFAVVDVAYGQTLRIADHTGGSAVQLVLVVAGDQRDRFSAPNTAVLNKSIYFSTGAVLYSYFYQPMMTITEDSVGRHSLLPTPLPAAGDSDSAGVRSGQGLLELAVANLGLTPSQTPFPFQAFIHHALSDTGVVSEALSHSKPGDAIAFRAELDLRAVVVNNPALIGEPAAAASRTIEVSVNRAVREK
ncbi:MAG: urea carboxylase-associated family protein [Mycobacterium sp.]